MTKQVTIVNSSNWDGEPVTVDGVLLMPGEMVTYPIDKAKTAEIVSIKTPHAARPFGTDDGHKDHVTQVMPEVQVAWVRGGAMLRGNSDFCDVTDKLPLKPTAVKTGSG